MTTTAAAWRHVETVPADDWAGDTDATYPVCAVCGCTTPTPDHSSLCAVCGCPISAMRHWGQLEDETMHQHVPTRCTCGHALPTAAALPSSGLAHRDGRLRPALRVPGRGQVRDRHPRRDGPQQPAGD